ncbi:hypothetical protein [Paenibacillus sp. KN14-4R]|uniref:hypothetical protein n=1 Tax=Paenibacillus sp. KN14-4R TaxID=3445773 RepID=UPI003FA18558
MRIIKTYQDVEFLRRAGVLPAPLFKHVDGYFRQLEVALRVDEETTFCLNRHGCIVILEAGDNVRDLGIFGLSLENGGLLGSYPEYVEMLDLDEGLQAYKVAVQYDNDYLKTFFTQAGAHDEEVEQWLKDQAERS